MPSGGCPTDRVGGAHVMDPVFRRLDEIGAILDVPSGRFRRDLVDERDRLLDRLCEEYLAATARRRGAIRRYFEGKARLLIALEAGVARSAYRIKGLGDVDRLRLGLAAASINDARIDYRDLGFAIEHLARAATAAGIDARPHFRDVAELSSRKRTGTCPGSMRGFLRLWSEV